MTVFDTTQDLSFSFGVSGNGGVFENGTPSKVFGKNFGSVLSPNMIALSTTGPAAEVDAWNPWSVSLYSYATVSPTAPFLLCFVINLGIDFIKLLAGKHLQVSMQLSIHIRQRRSV